MHTIHTHNHIFTATRNSAFTHSDALGFCLLDERHVLFNTNQYLM